MNYRYLIVGLSHFVCVALGLKVLAFILPQFLTCYYNCAASLLMCIVVAKLTFSCTKRHFLNDEIQPDNKAVLITGCDSGFGHALAKHLDSKGFHVFASVLFPQGKGAEDLKKSRSKRLQVLELDVTKDDSVKSAVEFVKDNLGTSELWAVVNNAGIIKGFSAELTGLQDFKDTMEVNAFGAVRVAKAFLPLLRQSKGRVVNITSMAGRLALPHCTPYTMSKFAIVGFTECLRQEMDVWGVKCISIEPEFFQTELTRSENILKQCDSSFESIAEDVKADYGEEYLKDIRKTLTFNVASPKVYKVVRALEMAICLENPSTSYRPARNVAAKILLHVYELLPDVLRDLLYGVVSYVTGCPRPKEAVHNL